MRPIINTTSLRATSLQWSPEPLKPGVTIKALTNRELFEKYKVQRRESIYQNGMASLPLSLALNTLPSLPKDIMKQMQGNMQKLVICDMNNNLGAGVFAKEMIEKDEYVFMYTGILEPLKNHTIEEDYNLSCLIESHTHPVEQYAINAQDFGNIARFIQDLPNEPTLEPQSLPTLLKKETPAMIHYELTFESTNKKAPFYLEPELKPKIAYANLVCLYYNLQINGISIPIPLFKTTCTIKPFEMLGFAYGFKEYWIHCYSRYRFFYKENYDLVPVSKYGIQLALLENVEGEQRIIHKTNLLNYLEGLEKGFLANQFHELNFFSTYIGWRLTNRVIQKPHKPHKIIKQITYLPRSNEVNIIETLLKPIIANQIQQSNDYEVHPLDLALLFAAACVQLAKFATNKEKEKLYLCEAKKYFKMLDKKEKHREYLSYQNNPDLFSSLKKNPTQDTITLLPSGFITPVCNIL